MTIDIPVQNIEKLTKKINRIINKGAPITFVIGEDSFIPFKIDGCDKTFYTKAKKVTVEGSYIINGWRFVATLEHKENGKNIIRCIDSSLEGKIPEIYRTCGPHCDHCKQARHRKDTYLVYNESTKEFKQVGKSCLMEYTCGLDAEICAQMCSVIPMLHEASVFDEGFRNPSNSCASSREVKQIAYVYVAEHGYTPKETTRVISMLVFGMENQNAKRAPQEEVDKVNAWVETLDTTNNDYLYNAKVAWESSYSEYRDIALIASLINTYFKEMARLEELKKQNNTYMGNVGDKVTFQVASRRVLYSKGKYAYYGDEVLVYEIKDTQGHTILWSTSSMVQFGDIIQAKIKSLGEYKGVKQTIITRGTILYTYGEENSPYLNEQEREEAIEHKNQAKDALDKFLSLLE